MTASVLLPITSTLTGALLILLMVLSAAVTDRRARLGGLEFGDADDVSLRHRIRAHGNFIEIAPMVILGIGLMEYAGASTGLVWWMAIVFFVGRLLHALRMYARYRWFGLPAIVSQHVICLIAGVWLIDHFIAHAGF